MARQTLAQKTLDMIDRFTPVIREAFYAALADIKDAVILNRVIEAIEAGDVVAAFEALGFSQAAMRPLTAVVEQAFETGGVMTANHFPRTTAAVFRFDVRNSRAEAWLRDHSSTLVTQITEETRIGIRAIIELGMQDGRNPRNVALDIIGRINQATGRREGGVIGLTSQQAEWVGNARRELSDPRTASHWFTRTLRDKRFDKIVQKSITDQVALDSDTVARLTTRYSDSLLRMRGETIARTEALQSLNTAQDMAFRQAIDEGVVTATAVTRTWDSAGDNRVRETHRHMDGQRVGLDEPFRSRSGAQLMFPGDSSLGAPASEIINCRCVVRHSVDWLAGVE